MNSYDLRFTVILIGDSDVGKTSLIDYYANGECVSGEMNHKKTTVAADVCSKILQISPEWKVKLNIWDTAGQERYRSVTKQYFRYAAGIMLVYDVTNYKSFRSLEQWYQEAQLYLTKTAVFTLVGQKADKEEERCVSTEEGQAFAEVHLMNFHETSAKDGRNVPEAFLGVALNIYKLLQEGQVFMEDGWSGITQGNGGDVRIRLYGEEKTKKKCC